MRAMETVVFFLSLLSFAHTQECSRPKKNLLFITADQFRADALRYAQDRRADYEGYEKIDTPNLDALAKSGAFFENAYVVSQNCVPSRATYTTGLTLQRAGIFQGNMLEEKIYSRNRIIKERVLSSRTYEAILSDELGYNVENFGKWHMVLKHFYGKKGRAVRFNEYSFQEDKFFFDPNHMLLRPLHLNFLKWSKKPRLTLKNGWQRSSEGTPYYPANELDARYQKRSDFSVMDLPKSLRSNNKEVGQIAWPEEFSSTSVLGTVGVKALTRLAKESKGTNRTCGAPFSLTLNFDYPHPSYIATDPYFSKYFNKRGKLYVPDNMRDGLKNSAYKPSKADEEHGFDYSDPKAVSAIWAAYYANIEQLDGWIGKILEVLEEQGIRDDTLIIFTSDHGDMLGSHSLMGKSVLYESSIKVPLLISGPPIPPETVVTHPVSLIDLVSTILYYLGASQHDDSDGRPLHRFIANPDYRDDLPVVHEYEMKYPKDDVTFKGKGGAYLNFAVIMDDMKLMMTKSADSDLMDMMFNLRTDLNEKRNLLGHNAAQATDLTIGRAEYLKIMLLKWMMAKDRKGGYYSDPKTSVLGSSDIEQIRRRRTWPEIDLWTSHSPVVFQGRPEKVLNRFKATRKLYIGHTTPGSLIIESIVKSGRTARFFSVKNFSNGRSIMQGNYLILKVCFESDWRSSFTGLAASITITYRVGNTGQRKKKTVFIRGRA